MRGWVAKLDSAAVKTDSLVCIGLDPDPDRLPVDDVLRFNASIVDATNDLVCAYKPNLAFYEALGLEGLRALRETVDHIRRVAPHAVVVGDAKRGDVGSTARAYATAMFSVWDFDVVTVHPYLGWDGIEPFLAYEGRGALVVCRTSNPSAREIQDAVVKGGGGATLHEVVARKVASWNTHGALGLVVGATYPEDVRKLRAEHPDLPMLLPGVGAQGGDARLAVRCGANAVGRGVMVNATRSIIYASGDVKDYAVAARAAAERLRDDLRDAMRHPG